MPDAKDAEYILQRYWGFQTFRPLQKEIIDSVLDRRDTLALMPTGGGKSVCFQVPGLLQDGLCLVISPLIALMKDQAEGLRSKGVNAQLIHSGMKRIDVIRTLQQTISGHIKFLYVSPERLETGLFQEFLPAMNINLIAVDEAHCISQWGYDFRPSYIRIAALREELPHVPLLALTASATPEVQQDIIAKLQLANPAVFKQPIERKNLSFRAERVDARLNRLPQLLKKAPGSAIVYCRSRKRTVDTASLLQLQGIPSHFYHAGLTYQERGERQQDWLQNKVRVMASTNAFGMGIDKPDVRTVIHLDSPDCLENYYQEAGRAGRDGAAADAILLYQEKDLEDLSKEHLVRYPEFSTIQSVYQSVVNYLQIPAYSGLGNSYRFRFDEFVRNFGLPARETLFALKALEQDGWFDFNEKSFAPSTIAFTTAKVGLYEFQSSYPQHEELVVTLLRTYEGIFDFPVFISEWQLARLLRKEETEIRQELKTIASFGILDYQPQHEDPQLIFRRNRVPVQELRFDAVAFRRRKEAFIARAEQMIAYVRTSGCRSRFLSVYFGDLNGEDCGICDNCQRKRTTPLTADEFKLLADRVLQLLSLAPLSPQKLMEQLDPLPKSKLLDVLAFLQDENKIRLGGDMLQIAGT
jgi:ATP-dependent DNA helicase RecQ